MSRVWHAGLHGTYSPVRHLPCVGCGTVTTTRGKWAVCPDCQMVARRVLASRLRAQGLTGGLQMAARNQFWSSPQEITAAIAGARVGATA
jgi:hypothetical protein